MEARVLRYDWTSENRWAPASTSSILSLPKMSSDANVFEISDIQEDETETSLKLADQLLHRYITLKLLLDGIFAPQLFATGTPPVFCSKAQMIGLSFSRSGPIPYCRSCREGRAELRV